MTALGRKIGYIPQKSSDWDESAFTRPLMGGEFPRFHLYIKETEKDFIFNLHLDQQQSKYGRHTAHGGEYAGETVEIEAKRIQGLLNAELAEKRGVESPKEIKKEESGQSLTALFRKMFGN